ncbi:MAG: aconitate hydratase, partial [Pseudomonadales bacterium]|nr:aconitate hydratase [Pseudomonadales bacterium]
AESFERLHRSNLAGMGAMPLQFESGISRKTLQLTGDEKISLKGLGTVSAGMNVNMHIEYADGRQSECQLLCRLDTALEVAYYNSGGIMPFVVEKIASESG